MKYLRLITKRKNKALFTARKATNIILIIAVLLQSNAQLLGSIVFAEDTSATGSADISELRVESDKEILLDTEISQNFSAEVKQKSEVKTLSKKHYRASEKISVVIAHGSEEKFTIKVEDPAGEQAEVEVQQQIVNDEKVLEILPPQQFRPGKYTVEIKDAEGHVESSQDFLWGVLAINTNKSVYSPNEKAKLSFAVLDELGYMVCDANLKLSITNPTGTVDELSTESKSIKVNDQCNKKEFSLTPDFEAEYQMGEVGKYEMKLVAEIKNGSYSISDNVEVKDYVPFEVERKTATRIFPPETYPMEFTIKANEDFSGTITDVVPEGFEIIEEESEEVEEFDEVKTLARAVVQGPQVLGVKANLGLPLKEERQVTSVFGDTVEDPLLMKKYAQYGLHGHDGIDFAVEIGTEVISIDKGKVVLAQVDGDYGTTLVIEHEWGKSYYGHLSDFKVEVGDEVEKGDLVALSGNTGLSTGPHLHFGIKPNENDSSNGYFGKIDPAPYLGLPDESSVLGASTTSSMKVKVISWEISLKKSEEITLGYSYKTPPKSPQFYTLGTAKFYDEASGKVFEEGRVWQLAIDANNYVGRHIKTIEYALGNTNITNSGSNGTLYSTDAGVGNTNGWTSTAPTVGTDGFTQQIEGTNIQIEDAWIEFRAQTFAAAHLSDLRIALSTCPGSVASCGSAPVYRELPMLGNPNTIFYFLNTGESNILYAKAEATAAFDGISDSDWETGVESILRVSATGPTLTLHTAKLIITYSAEFDTNTHEEIKTVRFPLDSDVTGDTGSKRTAISAGSNQTFSYNAQIPDLASNSDIVDVYFEVSAQVSASATNGTMTAQIVSGSPTTSPSYPTVTSLGNTADAFNIFKPTIDANNFQPNTGQQLRIAAVTNPIQGAGGELVVTYRYSTDEPVQTETVRYFVVQNATNGSTAKNTTTFAPVISNAGLSVKNIYAKVQGTVGAARNLTVFGDIDNGGGVTEKSNAYTFVFTGGEEIGTQRVFYDMSADAASFSSGGNMTVSTQWSGTLGGPTLVELFVTFTWDGDDGGVQTRSVQYFMENPKIGGTTNATAQTQKNINLNLKFPETATKTLRSAYVENAIMSSDLTSPVNVNMDVDADSITSNGSGFISTNNTGEALSYPLLENISASVDVSVESQSLIFNYISDATTSSSPKAIVTYDVDFSESGSTVPNKQIETVEYSFGNSNTVNRTSGTTVYATDAGTGGASAWDTTAPTQADQGISVKLEGTNVKVKQAWIEFRAQTTAAGSLSDIDMKLSTCVSSCTGTPTYRSIPALGSPTTVQYFVNSGETNVFEIKGDARGAFDDISDAQWSTGVETILQFRQVGPAINAHTAKLVITYESDYTITPHDEVKTVRFPLDSTNGTDTGSRTTQLAAGSNQSFDYNANIPDLDSNSDIYDVYFEIYGQTGSSTGTMTARVVSGSQTDSPAFPNFGGVTLTTQGNRYIFRPTVGTNNFQPNTAQQLNITATTAAVNALGGELVVTYKYSTDEPVQTETITYFASQQAAGAINTKVSTTIAPVISNTGASVSNIYTRATAHNVAATNLTLYGDIDNGGGVTEKSKQYTLAFASEMIAATSIIYDMSADAASFVSGGNLSTSTQFSNTSGGPVSVELVITFTWDGDEGGEQTKTVQYGMDSTRVGGTAAGNTQTTKNVPLVLLFPESVTKTLNSAYVQNWIIQSGLTSPVTVNQEINAGTIVANGSGYTAYVNTGEAMMVMGMENGTSVVNVAQNKQNLIFNQISNGMASYSPKALVTYNADFPSSNVPPGTTTLYPEDGSSQIGFNHIRQNSTTPTFRVSATHVATFDRFQLELNTASNFSGTAYTQTFTGTYSSGTEYNITASSLSPNLPTTDGATYYVRARASADGGSNWGSWSTGVWAYTYSSSGDPNWFQTTDAQFNTGTLIDTVTSGSGSVGLGGGPTSLTAPSIDYSDQTSSMTNTNPTWTPSGGPIPAGKLIVAVLVWSNHPSSSGTMTLPSGWTAWINLPDIWGSSNTLGTCLCYKYTGSSEPSSYAWTKSGTISYWEITAAVVADADPEVPFQVLPSPNLGADASVEHLSLTTTTDDSLVMLFGVNETGGMTITPPAGFSEVEDDGIAWLSHDVKDTAGAVGDQTTTMSASSGWISFMIAVNPEIPLAPTLADSAFSGLSWQQTTQTLTFSSIPSNGQLIILEYLQTDSGEASRTWPSGFTEFINEPDTPDNPSYAAAWKIASGESSATYTLTLGDAGDGNQIMMGTVYDGANTTDPIDVVGSGQLYNCPSSFTLTGITTTVDNTLLRIGMGASDTWLPTIPGWATVTPGEPYNRLWGHYRAKASAGPTGSIEGETASCQNPIAVVFAIAPSAVTASEGTIMSPEIDFDWFNNGDNWNEVDWSSDETDGDITLQVYYSSSTACDTIVPDGALSGNSSGFSSGPIDISGLSTSTYNKICLLATLENVGGTPYLEDWVVTWIEASGPVGPTLSQLMRHGAWFDGGALQPFTF